MYFLEVVFNPLDKVIFERPLDSLMKEVTGEEFVNISTWESHHKWLWDFDENVLIIDTRYDVRESPEQFHVRTIRILDPCP